MYSQNCIKCDSLTSLIASGKTDTIKVNNLNKLTRELIQNDSDSALNCAIKSLQIAEELKYEPGKALASKNIAMLHHYKGKFTEAKKYYFQAIDAYDKSNDLKGKGICYNNLGSVYTYEGNYPDAIDYYQKSLKIDEQFKDTNGIALSYMNIGLVHDEQKNYPKAIEYYNEASSLFKILTKRYPEDYSSMYGLAGCYNNKGLIYETLNNLDSALLSYENALLIMETLDNQKGMSICYNNMGNIYTQKENYTHAIELYSKALEIKEKISDKEGMISAYTNIGNLYLQLENYENAEFYLKNATKMAKELGALPRLSASLNGLVNYYESLNNYKEAFIYQKELNNVNDSLFNIEKNEHITEIETKYQTEKKEQEIAILNKDKQLQEVENKKQRYIIYTFLLGFFIIIVFVVLLLRMYRQKRIANNELKSTLKKLEETQEQLVESEKMASLGNLVAGVAHEINTPVGIGITASSSLKDEIKNFAQNFKSGQMTKKDLVEFLQNTYDTTSLILKNLERTGELVRTFKQVSIDQTIEEKRNFNLVEYTKDVISSLKPEINKNNVNIQVETPEEYEICSYPGAFAQIYTNLILNSITHGFSKDQNKEIIIQFSKTENHLSILYSDNGKGISKEIQSKIFDPFFTTN
ncbi:MAG: hypothetical protein C0594_11205, partial [Marinilabiliales bacterium]